MIRFVGEHLQPQSFLIIDVNQGWQLHDALRVEAAVREIDVLFEQPCATYEKCKAFKQATGRPISLDEIIFSPQDLIRAYSDGVIDVLNLKIGRIGGLTRSRELRDLAVAMGVRLKIQDTSGSEFNAAAIAHLAHSTPPQFVMGVWDCANFVTLKTGTGLIRDETALGWASQHANQEPGLGVTPLMEVLGEPVAVYD